MTAYRPTFVSHAHADNALCDRYAAALTARGIDVWYDRHNIQGGQRLGKEIETQLERRNALVVLLTPASVASYWVDMEVSAFRDLAAHDPSRLLLPVRIADCSVPLLMRGLFWIDALAMPFEQAIDAIGAALTLRDNFSASDLISPPQPVPITPPLPTLPPLGPAPVPAGATPAHHLTPMSLYTLGFRGWNVGGVECVLPPICPVPGGIFTMGSDKTYDTAADDDETPQYPIHVNDFSIGQHPVTVAEYACAVRVNVVREPPPSEYQGKETDWQIQQSHLDHPVVCISWRDAVAYTCWLVSVTGQHWRPPTEAEWEKMARWDAKTGQSRIFPWGDTLDKARCNSFESGIGTTTSVGCYPSGASPYGAQDVAGNVREWTSSLFKPYPYNEDDGREDQITAGNRVLRGGAWNTSARSARTAHRVDDWSGGFLINYGFRLALAPVRAGS